MGWYKKAAELGDKRAAQRLKSQAGPLPRGAPGSMILRDDEPTGNGKGGKDKDCVIM